VVAQVVTVVWVQVVLALAEVQLSPCPVVVAAAAEWQVLPEVYYQPGGTKIFLIRREGKCFIEYISFFRRNYDS
jgi:hypothetical protein